MWQKIGLDLQIFKLIFPYRQKIVSHTSTIYTNNINFFEAWTIYTHIYILVMSLEYVTCINSLDTNTIV